MLITEILLAVIAVELGYLIYYVAIVAGLMLRAVTAPNSQLETLERIEELLSKEVDE